MTYLADDPEYAGAPPAGERARPRRAMGCAFEIVETLVLTLLIYLLIHNFIAQPFEVQQSSMLPTITPQEYILIDKLTPRWQPYERGDIVVFQPPEGYEQGGVPFIKRVLGLPGDTVSLENGRVYVTPEGGAATLLEEPYLASEPDGRPEPTQPRPPDGDTQWVVPEGAYFVLGDHRGVSQDSRVFGPVSQELIVGRAWLRYFPVDRIGFLGEPEYPQLASGEETSYPLGGSSATIQASTARP